MWYPATKKTLGNCIITNLSLSCRLHPTKSWRVRKLKTKKDSIHIYIYSIYIYMIVYSHMTYHTSCRESISAGTKLHASKAARLKEVAEMGTEAMPHEAGYSGSVSSVHRVLSFINQISMNSSLQAATQLPVWIQLNISCNRSYIKSTKSGIHLNLLKHPFQIIGNPTW